MRKIILSVLTLSLFLPAMAGSGKFVGGDISMLPKIEANISYYKDDNGKRINDLVTWLVDSCGWNTFRVRLFVNPDPDFGKNNYKNVNTDITIIQDLDYVKALGRRIKDKGANFMLDLHYSDFWVDASKIKAPTAWQSANDEQMADSVAKYTRMVLDTLIANNATPDFVQIGNEIMYGMCGRNVHPYNYNGDKWDAFAQLLKVGSEAVRDKCPNAQIIIHTDRPTNITYNNYWYQKVIQYGVDFDIIGLSYYPFWHGTLTTQQAISCIGYSNNVNLKQSLDNFATTFPDKKVHIVEFAYNFQYSFDGPNYDTSTLWPISVDGQYQLVSDLVDLLAAYPQVEGLNYWYPEDAGNGDYLSKWDGTDPRMIEQNWSNRGLWSEGQSKTGHSINLTSKKQCVQKRLRDFLSEEQMSAINDIKEQKAYKANKYMLDGQIIIEKNGVLYNILGTPLK